MRFRIPFWSLVLWGVLAGVLLPSSGAAQDLTLAVHPSSQFWIQGETTVNSFTCVVDSVEGGGGVPRNPSASNADTLTVTVNVPVPAFDCGNRRMTEDLKETLKVQQHRLIQFQPVHATVGSPPDTSRQWHSVHALGPLIIAGTKRLVRIEAAGRLMGSGRFRVRGCTPVKMTYFGIDPPSKALGLIKVKNRVEVQFDLLAYVPEQGPPPAFDTITNKPPPTCND
jgi:hypothetical protein